MFEYLCFVVKYRAIFITEDNIAYTIKNTNNPIKKRKNPINFTSYFFNLVSFNNFSVIVLYKFFFSFCFSCLNFPVLHRIF